MRKAKFIIPILAGFLVAGIVLAINQFPTSLNNFAEGDPILNTWANALEAKIGIDNSAVASSLDYLVKNANSKLGSIVNSTAATGTILYWSGGKWIGLPVGTAGQSLMASSTGALYYSSAAAGVSSLNGITGATIIAGTANQINVASSSQTITLSTPQNIATGSSPTFAGITLSSLISGFLKTNASGTPSTSTVNLTDDSNLVAGAHISTSTDGQIDVDSELSTKCFSVPINNATTTQNGYIQHTTPVAITITNVSCFAATTTNSNFTFQADERATSTVQSAGTDILLGDLTCASTTNATTSFANAGIAAWGKINFDIDSVSVSGIRGDIHVCYTIDD